MESLKNFIGGEWMPAVGGAELENFAPATGKAYSRLPDSDGHDVERAVKAAKAAFPAWSALPSEERARVLRRVADGIAAKAEVLAFAESVDSGKPLKLCREVDIPRSRRNFEFFADASTQFSSEAHVTDVSAVNFTLRQPLGVVGCISPWNLPLYLLSWKVAPALAAGNTVVAKPSEVTPVTAHMLSQICREAGMPPGVLNLVHGAGPRAGAALVAHPEVKAVSFTGSTRVGASIASAVAPLFKKVSLELGGKNPSVVFADADLEHAAAEVVRGAFSNQGQICLCGSRILVQKAVYERFKEMLVARVRGFKIGDPLDEATDQGALVSKAHFEKVVSYLELARAEGGKFLTGGKVFKGEGRCKDGWFVEPTLVEGLSSECRVNQEEIFGPVATLIPFETEDEALAIANSTPYGLAASLWTRDLPRALRLSRQVRAGIVWVNCWMERDLRTPFGGVKDSGVGREGGWEAMRFFTEPKNVCLKG